MRANPGISFERMPLVLPLHQPITTTKFARAHHGAHHGLVRRGLQHRSFYRYITTDKFGSIDHEHGGHIANAMRRIVALLTILPAAAGAPLTPRRRTDTGPVDYNPAKGTGCARANTERLEQGKDSDFWDGGFYFEVRAPRGGACVCACVERGRLASRPPSPRAELLRAFLSFCVALTDLRRRLELPKVHISTTTLAFDRMLASYARPLRSSR